ncbi:MAG: peptidylprolyl isomerase [Campylobacterota bacterium]|nr:peptidylprolyl isomerase [Campylobacterota bacterium]
MKKTIISLVASIAITSTTLSAQDKVYAVVNGSNITSSDIAVAIRDPRIQFQTLPSAQQKQIIEGVIEQKLLSQEAMKSNIVKTKEYKNELAKLKEMVAYQLWMRDLSKDIKVSQKDLKSFFDKNRSKFKKPEQFKASHILVKTQKEAEDIIKTLKGSKDLKSKFSDLAKAKSVGPSSSNGGELGWFGEGQMVPEFTASVKSLSKGDITNKPVKTQFGFHVIYLDDKKAVSSASFESVKATIQQQLTQKKFFDMVKEKAVKLKEKAKIEYK